MDVDIGRIVLDARLVYRITTSVSIKSDCYEQSETVFDPHGWRIISHSAYHCCKCKDLQSYAISLVPQALPGGTPGYKMMRHRTYHRFHDVIVRK